MQIIVCRRGLPRSGLYLAYVAVGRVKVVLLPALGVVVLLAGIAS